MIPGLETFAEMAKDVKSITDKLDQEEDDGFEKLDKDYSYEEILAIVQAHFPELQPKLEGLKVMRAMMPGGPLPALIDQVFESGEELAQDPEAMGHLVGLIGCMEPHLEEIGRKIGALMVGASEEHLARLGQFGSKLLKFIQRNDHAGKIILAFSRLPKEEWNPQQKTEEDIRKELLAGGMDEKDVDAYLADKAEKSDGN